MMPAFAALHHSETKQSSHLGHPRTSHKVLSCNIYVPLAERFVVQFLWLYVYIALPLMGRAHTVAQELYIKLGDGLILRF